MRTYGRVYPRNPDGSIQKDANGFPMPGKWVVVETDAAGFNDAVYLTTLAQCLQGNLNESPFFANYGINQHQSVETQVFPDYYMWITQSQFSQFFASLIIARQEAPTPTYRVNVMTSRGERLTSMVAV
jgi:hypothetical protein